MRFEIYCDESQPDVFWSRSPKRARFLMIGSLWLPADLRAEVKDAINSLKTEYGFAREIKWHHVSSGHQEFYRGLVDLFLRFDSSLRFRCIAVEGDKVDMARYHESDAELGFYKFYYHLLKNWIEDFSEYRVFCDEKTNRAGGRLRTLRRCLACANLSSNVEFVQALPSHDVVLLQMVDFLLGMASARLNDAVQAGGAKDKVARHLEKALGMRLAHTPRNERKFNIFQIRLNGGW
ncbi:MAG: DUF3800 domain-containing protein [Thermodesulfobacteriota bacterium]